MSSKRIIHLDISTSTNTEKLMVVANNLNEFCQRIYAWLNHEKIGEDYRLVNNNADDNDVYWLDAGNAKEGFVSLSFQSSAKFDSDDDVAFSTDMAKAMSADIFANEQDFPVESISKVLSLNAVRTMHDLFVELHVFPVEFAFDEQ